MHDLFHDRPVRPPEQTSNRGVPTRFEPARILSVDLNTWTAHVQPLADSRIITEVPWLSPYEHPDGSGIYVVPQRGALGLLVYYDRGSPRFLCYRSEDLDGEGYKGRKHDLAEGDMILKAPYGSYVLLRETGTLDLFSNAALRLSLLPYTNTLFWRAERLDVAMIGGRWQWTHDRGDPITPRPKKTTLTELYREESDKDNLLTIKKGWHDDRAMYSVLYEDDDDRRVLWKLGKIDDSGGGLLDAVTGSDPGDDRLVVDVDSGSYRKTIGERDDGTVVRTTVTGRGNNRDWRKVTKVGKQSDDTVVHDRVESGQSSVDLSIQADGQVDLAINGDKMTLSIDTDGNITIQTHADAFTRVVCNDIRLGGLEQQQQAVLGNLFRTYMNSTLLPAVMAWVNGHQHIGNMGSPTTPPIVPATMATDFREMPENNLSTKVRIEP